MAGLRGSRRGVAAVGAVLVATCTVAGCAAARPAPERPAPGLLASVTQFRPDEGTRNLHAGITNRGGRPVTVTSATVVWSGFSWSTVRVPAEPVPPGQTAAFVVRYGAPHCATRPGAPYLRTVVDGRRLVLPLTVDIPGLLPRLRAHACGEQRLARTASLRLRLARRTVVRGGAEYLPGTVLLRRRPGTSTPVSVVDLGGSVLFDLVPAGEGALPFRLAPADRVRRLPVLVGSAGRCDPHARGNSSQTFLFSTYSRLGGGPVVRSIFVPAPSVQQRLWHLLDRACGAVGPAA
jgi:hypothetical protein